MTDQARPVRDPDTGLFVPDHYDAVVRERVVDYELFQQAVADATTGLSIPVRRVLDLGIGTGETAGRVAALHPDATFAAIDESQAMLDVARTRLGNRLDEGIVGSFVTDMPEGPFDVVISALAIHHLNPVEKQDLYRRVAAVLRPGGRFVQGDIRSDGPGVFEPSADDLPELLADTVRWLSDADLQPHVIAEFGDTAVVAADST